MIQRRTVDADDEREWIDYTIHTTPPAHSINDPRQISRQPSLRSWWMNDLFIACVLVVVMFIVIFWEFR